METVKEHTLGMQPASQVDATKQQPKNTEVAKKENSNVPAKSISGDAPQADLIKIQQGLPEQLQPLRECFTEPFKTFVQCGRSLQDLQKECNFAAQAMTYIPN